MRLFSGVSLTKPYPNPTKTETSKLSLEIITPESFDIFSNGVILLVILDTGLVLDYSTL